MVFPGAAYVEAALAAFGEDTPCVLENVVLHRTLALPRRSVTTLRVSHDPRSREVTMRAHRTGNDTGWSLHATLRRSELPPPTPAARIPGPPEGWAELDHDEIYTLLAGVGLDYSQASAASGNCGGALGRWSRSST